MYDQPIPSAGPEGAVRADPRRNPRGHGPRVRRAVLHRRPRSRGAGEGSRGILAGAVRHRRHVGHRRPDRRADGDRASSRATRSSPRRTPSLPPPAASTGSARSRSSSTSTRTPTTSTRRGSRRRSPSGRGRSFPCTCTGRWPIWTRSWRSREPPQPGRDRGRGPGDRRGVPGAGGPARSATSAASASSPRRTSAASATAAWSPRTTRPWRTRPSCCATTARSRSTITSWSAATSGSTRCRRRSCGSSCHHLDGWTAGRQRNAARYRQLFAGRQPGRRWPGRRGQAGYRSAGRGAGAPSHLQPVRDPDGPPRRGDRQTPGAQDRRRDLLPRAAAPSGVLRRSRIRTGQPAARGNGRGRNPGAPHLSGTDGGNAGRGGGSGRSGVRLES